MIRILKLVTVAALSAACSEAKESGAPGGGGSSAEGLPAGRCEVEQRVGNFEVAIEATFSAVSGQVADRVALAAELREIGSEGACRLIQRVNPYCSPACGSEQMCVAGSKCEPAPVSKSVGLVTVTGLAKPVAMQPKQPGNRYFDAGLPHPGVEPGALVELSAEGGAEGPFRLTGEGVARVELPEVNWPIARGQPVQVVWTKPAQASSAKVRITLSVDQHGLTPSVLECQSEDSGAFTISSTLVDSLLDAGISGFPTGHVYRETADSLAIGGGCIQLVVFAHAQRMLEVTGHTACDADADCKDGASCDLPTNTCR